MKQNVYDDLNNVHQIGKFVRKLVSDGITSDVTKKKCWVEWKKENEEFMEDVFGFQYEEGLCHVYDLVSPFFHDKLDLIGVNYTPGAHNLLHKTKTGWTNALKLCRGLIFNSKGELVAKPFKKFFTLNEHPESTEANFPNTEMEIYEKYDGHLGICFAYGSEIVIATRGSFQYSDSAREIMEEIWKSKKSSEGLWCMIVSGHTLLFEIIHPDTEVKVEYNGEKKLVLIGAFSNSSLRELDYSDLKFYSSKLGIDVAKRYDDYAYEALIEEKYRPDYVNQEGYVIKFANGLRVKVKYEKYIGELVKDKLSYRYVMLRLMNGDYGKMIGTLDFEYQEDAAQMVKDMKNIIHYQHDGGKFISDRKKALYELEDDMTQYSKKVCRDFLKFCEGKTMEEVFNG